MNNIDLIGGSGFIGSRLMGRLMVSNINRVKIIDKAPSKAFPDYAVLGDVRSIDQLRAEISEDSIIINLAAEHRDDVRPLSLYEDVNVEGAKNICIVAREKGVKMIIFTSTVAVYGFSQIGTDESGKIAPFSDYGRTKYEAEQVFKVWQCEAPTERALVIIRPTVVFGEQNRGNVYNLMRQIAFGKFVMVGHGKNRKSLAYVENVAAFIEYTMCFKPGVYIYNFIDKPDFTMNDLVMSVKRNLGRPEKIALRLPFAIGYMIGKGFDLVAAMTGKRFAISLIRIKKFCANSVYGTAINQTGFVSPVAIEQAITQTVRYEFIESNEHKGVFYTE
jgi:nucleoside-diphosphate-sugar epimerase